MGIVATNPARLATAAPSDGEKFTYVYNPWGQLVEIKKIGGGSVTHAKYTYSAMGHRISEQLDTNDSSNSGVGDGVVDADDPVFFIATDPSGRRLATYRGTDSDPKETFIHHDARIRGPVHQGGPILRDRDADLADKPFYWASEPAASDRYERHYYALDYRGYVSAIFAGDGTLVEQVRYSATGVPFNIPLGDVNGDGKVEAGTSGKIDEDQIKTMYTAYHVRGDLDLDGDVDAADLAIATARDGLATGRGQLTYIGVGLRFLTSKAQYEGVSVGLVTNVVDQSVLHLVIGRTMNAPIPGSPFFPGPPLPGPLGPLLTPCEYAYSTGVRACNWMFTAGSVEHTVCLEVAHAAFQVCKTAINRPTDEVLGAACIRHAFANPEPPSLQFCMRYPPCLAHVGINFRCMCLCNLNAPAENFIRSCVQCGYRSGVSPTTIHLMCIEAARVLYGFPNAASRNRMALCMAGCLLAQQLSCGFTIEEY